MSITERITRRRTYKTLKSAMHGMTLNTIGRLYDVERERNEDNRSYERRILKVASKRAPDIGKMNPTEVKV